MRGKVFAFVLTGVVATVAAIGGAKLAAAGELKKEIQQLGMPWETSYGYAQAVRVGDTVWISGQLGHDSTGKLVGIDVESQMRQTYQNINTLLSRYGLTMDDVVEETAFTTDLPSAAAARSKMGHDVYPDPTRVASNLIGVSRLFFPNQNIEIGVVAKTK